jgi:hypothetical protein
MDLRAATTHPATLDLLDDELVGDMARVGLVAPTIEFVQEQSIAKKTAGSARPGGAPA